MTTTKEDIAVLKAQFEAMNNLIQSSDAKLDAVLDKLNNTSERIALLEHIASDHDVKHNYIQTHMKKHEGVLNRFVGYAVAGGVAGSGVIAAVSRVIAKI